MIKLQLLEGGLREQGVRRLGQDGPGLLLFGVVDTAGPELLGCAGFYLEKEGGEITGIWVTDRQDGLDVPTALIKGTLNSIDLAGFKSAVYTGDACRDRFLALGFQENQTGNLTLNLEGYFEQGCHCEGS